MKEFLSGAGITVVAIGIVILWLALKQKGRSKTIIYVEYFDKWFIFFHINHQLIVFVIKNIITEEDHRLLIIIYIFDKPNKRYYNQNGEYEVIYVE